MQEPTPTPQASAQTIIDRQDLRDVIRTHYDLQELRITIGNRLCGNFRVQLGQAPGTPTDELSPEAQKLLRQLKEEYRRLADVVANTPPSRWEKALLQHDGLIKTTFALALSRRYFEMLRDEERAVGEITVLLRRFPIWTNYLQNVRGVGPLMAGCIISELDPYKARHPSSFTGYTGLDTGPDGKARSRRAEHLVLRPYVAKDGTTKEKLSITYNPWLRTKLLGVLSGCFLRSGGPYAEIYKREKNRLEHHAVYGLISQEAGTAGTTPVLHRHRMALRYMVKMFLYDLWTAWRHIEGLEVHGTYAEEKLGFIHGQPRPQVEPHFPDPQPGEEWVSPAEWARREAAEEEAEEQAAESENEETTPGEGQEDSGAA